MSTNATSEFTTTEVTGEDYSSLVRDAYDKLFGSWLTSDDVGEALESWEQHL